jgi:HK97 family phage portal protein
MMGIRSFFNKFKRSGGTALALNKKQRRELSDMVSTALSEFKLRPQEILPVSMSNKPQWSTWSSDVAINEAFKKVIWVYVCAMKNALAISGLKWKAQIKRGDTWEDDPNSDLQKLLDRPNEFWSTQHFFMLVILELLLTGNCLVCKYRVDGKVVEMFTANPRNIAPVPSTTNHIDHYIVVGPTGKKYKLHSDDAIHMMLPDPVNPYWGLSPLQAVARAVETDSEAASWQKNSLHNNMVPPGIIQMGGHLGDAQIKNLRETLKEEYQGAINARRPFILGGGGATAVWQQLSLTPAEVDFIRTRELSREEICAAFGVPLPIAGILDNATYNNIGTAREIWWEDTLLPETKLVSDDLTHSLANEFDPNARVIADLSTVESLQPKVSRRIDSIEKLWKMGTPFNQAAETVGLSITIDGGDIGYVPSSVVPVDAHTLLVETVVPTVEGAVEGATDGAGLVSDDVQSTALNGAQVTALKDLLLSVSQGIVAGETAKLIIEQSFPGFDSDAIEKMVNAAVALAAKMPSGDSDSKSSVNDAIARTFDRYHQKIMEHGGNGTTH